MNSIEGDGLVSSETRRRYVDADRRLFKRRRLFKHLSQRRKHHEMDRHEEMHRIRFKERVGNLPVTKMRPPDEVVLSLCSSRGDEDSQALPVVSG